METNDIDINFPRFVWNLRIGESLRDPNNVFERNFEISDILDTLSFAICLGFLAYGKYSKIPRRDWEDYAYISLTGNIGTLHNLLEAHPEHKFRYKKILKGYSDALLKLQDEIAVNR